MSMTSSRQDKIEKVQVVIFAVYCVLTVVSIILSFTSFEPRYVSDGLTFLVAAIGGSIITFKSIKSLFEKELTIDFLASIAIIVSIAVGEYLAAAIVVVMLYGGELVEDYAAKKASQAIEKLIQSIPVTARI